MASKNQNTAREHLGGKGPHATNRIVGSVRRPNKCIMRYILAWKINTTGTGGQDNRGTRLKRQQTNEKTREKERRTLSTYPYATWLGEKPTERKEDRLNAASV